MRSIMLLFLDLFVTRSPVVYRVLLWVPLIFCIAAFSLLVVHFGAVLNGSAWKEGVRRRYAVYYVVANSLFFVAHAVIFVLGLVYPDDVMAARLQHAQDALVSSVFVMLGVVIGLYGWWMWCLFRREPSAVVHLGRHQTPLRMVLFVSFTVFVFVTRALLLVLLLFDVIDPAWMGERHVFDARGALWAATYVVWEIVPLVVFIVLFWPTNTRDRSLSSSDAPVSGPVSHSMVSSMDSMAGPPPIPINSAGDHEVLHYHPLPGYDSDEDERFTHGDSLYSPYSTTPNKLLRATSSASGGISIQAVSLPKSLLKKK